MVTFKDPTEPRGRITFVHSFILPNTSYIFNASFGPGTVLGAGKQNMTRFCPYDNYRAARRQMFSCL
jgi:hypothetical protein